MQDKIILFIAHRQKKESAKFTLCTLLLLLNRFAFVQRQNPHQQKLDGHTDCQAWRGRVLDAEAVFFGMIGVRWYVESRKNG